MSSTSVEPSPDAHHPPFRQSLYRVSPPPPPPPPASASDPPRPTPFGGPESSRTSSSSAASSDPEVYPLSALPVNSERRRDYTARMRLGRAHPPSDYDSDEDPSDMMETESETLSFLEQFSVGNMAFHGRDEEMRIRTQQMIRGQLTNKRVASKKAINQLQSVDISTLDESERSCVICYNEFGVPNPEGINEAPLRLPNCKHVFGDHCIKKWFEESDSCPYCRDKVPSEPVLTSNTRALHQIIQSYANNPRYAVASGRALADPALARMMAQREEARMMQREEARMAQREEARFEGSPPRTWQTGERRSPPSEASETRRRTRARHGSFRGSPATNTANSRPNLHGGMNPTAPLQQSPAPPPTGRQFMHMPSNHRLYGYSGVVRAPGMPPVEPFGLAPPSMPPSQMPYNPLLSPVEDQRFQNSLNGGSGPPVPAEPAQLPGPSHMTTFSQQLPPVGTLEPPSFPSTSSTANGHSNAAGDWMQ
ncbi:hypothetical protein B0T16DRAFT_385454 [Cercophora newfieldiana]|uniref:RING-type domain-containing protein n=1 Tax=Cercophora newfieldiana TaxID=92897 RepID=A0AA39YQJ9_9PEZI|nr:hypothetical protein B0T16DRAFT_385454 [Cercophora newfieldiana]